MGQKQQHALQDRQRDLTKDIRLRLIERFVAKRDLTPSPAQLEEYERFRMAGDPRADAFVAWAEKHGVGPAHKMFNKALTDGIDAVDDAPAELRDWFRDLDAEPIWLDWSKVEDGAKAISRVGPFGLLVLGDLALMGGYLVASATKPLVRTGELEAMAPRRGAETAAFWLDVTSPGGMRRNKAGFKAAVKVRLVHAHVRAVCSRDNNWDKDAWGTPVNQMQMVGTLLLFSSIYMAGLMAMGFRFSEREQEGILHLWRYIGLLMGIDERILPASGNDAWRTLWVLAKKEFHPDEDSKKLAHALTNALHNAKPEDTWVHRANAEFLTQYRSAFSRLVLGKYFADYLDIPDSTMFQGAVAGTAAVILPLEGLRKRLPFATKAMEVVGHQARRILLETEIRRLGGDRGYTPRQTS